MGKFFKKICFHKYERIEWFANEFKHSNEVLYRCIKCGKEFYVRKEDDSWEKDVNTHF